MTAYRFRVKFDPDPTALWRDIVVGADRSIDEFQSAINAAVGLDQGHLWFVGTDEDFWDSEIKYLCPQEYDEPLGGDPAWRSEQLWNAGAVTVGEMTRQVGLDRYDRLCYLYDFGAEWRFYAILKSVIGDEPSHTEPTVVKGKGDTIDQYTRATGETGETSLPAALREMLPETAVPLPALRALEEREDVVHVVSLLSLDSRAGPVCERFLIQLDDAGYLLENFQPGWQVVEQIEGTDRSEAALLAALTAAARDWHAEIAEISGAMTGQHFDEETVEAMNVELEAELERKGYGHL